MAVSGYTRLHRFEENQHKVYKPVHKLAAGPCPNPVASTAEIYIMFLKFTYCGYFRTPKNLFCFLIFSDYNILRISLSHFSLCLYVSPISSPI